MSNKLSLESLCKEATAKGLNINEIEHMKRHYYAAVREYIQRVEPKPGVEGAIQYLDMQMWTAYAAAGAYIRRTIDAIHKGEEK